MPRHGRPGGLGENRRDVNEMSTKCQLNVNEMSTTLPPAGAYEGLQGSTGVYKGSTGVYGGLQGS